MIVILQTLKFFALEKHLSTGLVRVKCYWREISSESLPLPGLFTRAQFLYAFTTPVSFSPALDVGRRERPSIPPLLIELSVAALMWWAVA